MDIQRTKRFHSTLFIENNKNIIFRTENYIRNRQLFIIIESNRKFPSSINHNSI